MQPVPVSGNMPRSHFQPYAFQAASLCRAVRQALCLLLLGTGAALYLPLPARAQSVALLDSLRRTGQAAADTAAVAALCELCYQYGASAPDSALHYGRKALDLAEQLKHPRLIAQACNDMGMVYHRMSRYDQAMPLYQRALAIRKKLPGNERQVAASLSKIGALYTEQSLYKEALQAQLAATRVFEKLHDHRAIAYSYNSLGRLLELQNQYDPAIEYRLRALAAARVAKDSVGMAGALQGIAVNYQQKGQLPEAISYFQRSLQIIRGSGDKNNLAAGLNNLGHSFTQAGDYPQALRYFQEAQTLNQEVGDLQSATLARLNMAGVYEKTSQYAEAIWNYQEALETAQEHKFRSLVSAAYAGLSDVYARVAGTRKPTATCCSACSSRIRC